MKQNMLVLAVLSGVLNLPCLEPPPPPNPCDLMIKKLTGCYEVSPKSKKAMEISVMCKLGTEEAAEETYKLFDRMTCEEMQLVFGDKASGPFSD